MSTDIKLSKAQISKIIQSGGSLGALLDKLAGSLIKVAAPLEKKVLAPLGITAAMSAIDGAIQKNTWFWNNNLKQALEDSNILLKGVSKTIKNETKERKGGFLSMLLGTLGASVLGNLLTGRGTTRAGEGFLRAGKGFLRAGEGIKKTPLIPPHSLKNFKIENYYENEPKFNGVYSRDALPKTIKNGAYVIMCALDMLCM